MNLPEPAFTRPDARDGEDRGLPLAFWLTLLVSLVLAAVIGTTSWLSWQNGQRAVVDLAGQLQSRVGHQVEEHLRGYLESPHIAVEMIGGALESGAISPDRPQSLYSTMLRLAQLYEGISYLDIGVADGRFFGLGRVDNKSRELVIEETRPPDSSLLYQYSIDARGARGALRKELPFSDFSQQVWYAEPLSTGRTSWTSIYSWVDNPDVVVISLGKPVTAADGTRAVVGVDLFLSNICDYLARLDVSPGARVFIVERNGNLVANSQGATLVRDAAGLWQRRPAAEAADPLIRGAAQYLERSGRSFASIDEAQMGEFDLDGKRQFLRISPWRDDLGLDWLIAVVVPEADFTTTIDANLRVTLGAGVALLLAALAVALLMARYISHPVRHIESAASAVAAGDFDTRVPRSAYREFNRLAHSFDAMTRQLRAAFLEVEESQKELERKVAQRTEELRQANDELARLSRQDSLTGLANRRCFDPTLREEWLRARRSGEPLTLVMCDIDYFKPFNDRYGHARGDEVLVKVARVLQSQLRRASDLAARYGGEEYALILPNTCAEDAQLVLAQVRADLAALAIVHEASLFGRITMSFGIACYAPGAEFASPEELLVAADQALYRAKAAGRDGIVVHERKLPAHAV